jgi:flagellar basal-body rod protein FlgB
VKIFDATLDTLERALDARLLRQNVLAGNLANANTPGYVPQDIDFAAAMRQTEPALVPAPPSPSTSPSPSTPGPAPLAPRQDIDLVSAGHPVESAGDIPLTVAGTTPGAVGAPIVTTQGAGAGIDGNAVDVDRALAAVAENAIQYGAAARAAQKKLAILRYVASDGAA